MPGHANRLFDPEAPPEGTGSAEQPDAHPDALSIGALYDQVEGALSAAFPRGRQVWVRGEIHSFSDQAGKSGHCYMDLVDPEEGRRRVVGRAGSSPALKVKCWRATWAPLRNALRREGITLAEGMVVVLRGTVGFWRPKGEVNFEVTELDVTSLLGRLAADRANLIRRLEAEGLLRRNAAIALPEVPLRIGLVASPGTEGHRDFLGQLHSSGFAFEVQAVPVTVQGSDAAHSVARAVRALGRSDCDVIVVVRGGGSKADLATFDAEVVARTIALSPKPVWTGIGHTGDESVADIVAGRCCITPTECGHQLVVRVSQWWDAHVAQAAITLSARVPTLLREAEGRDRQARGRLTHAARAQLRVHRERVQTRASRVARRAPEGLGERQGMLRTHAARLGPLASGHLDKGEERIRSWRRLLTAYDVERQLDRGYTLTLDVHGHLLRRAGDAAPGEEITTRFADGSVRSTVTSSETSVTPSDGTEEG